MPSLPFHVMAKPIGPKCNLRCAYCFYLDKDVLYPGERTWAMSDDVLLAYVRQVCESAGPVASFAWQGGEPTLLGLAFFERAVALQKEYGKGRQIENTIQTNGILLDDSWGEFLARERFLVGISVDGPAELHDAYRRQIDGGPTHEAVMRGLETLKRHGAEFNTLTVVNRLNGDRPVEVYRFLKSIGSRYLQFIPLVDREGEATVRPEQFGEFLIGVFDRWVKFDVGRVFVQQFDAALNLWYGLPSTACVFAETCGRAVALEHNGDVYSCDHYVFPEHRLGNLLDQPLPALVDSARQGAFGNEKRDGLAVACKRCEWLFACRGECPKNRFVASPDGEQPLNYLCPSYKRFFAHVEPAMRKMVELLKRERPPAEIMTPAPAPKTGRNDPCPCGSGRKFKACCGKPGVG